MSYPEVEQRRLMLAALRQLLESQELVPMLREAQIVALGELAGLSPLASKRLFMRLVEEDYVRVRHNSSGQRFIGTDQNPLVAVNVEDLTDKGLREINVLPPENVYEALVAGFEQRIAELEADPDLAPAEKQREVSRWQGVRNTLGELAKEIGAPIVGEVVKRSIGL